ncbi:hypothetical protein HOD75_00320 [archaeon]|jgi:hypothetical protein|nr:hypothetical protein [archaeon]MBT4241320.1 hypothetical protein [archaeon]MBT4418141.1 hypothetical protein [archaeon]
MGKIKQKRKHLIVKYVPPRERAKFPSLQKVLDRFVEDNDLEKPTQVTATETRGLLVYWNGGDLVNLFSFDRDSTAYDSTTYVMEGTIKGDDLCLLVHRDIPTGRERPREELTKETYRVGDDMRYKFLGK